MRPRPAQGGSKRIGLDAAWFAGPFPHSHCFALAITVSESAGQSEPEQAAQSEAKPHAKPHADR